VGTLSARLVALVALVVIVGPWCARARASEAHAPDPVEGAADRVARAVDARDDATVAREGNGADPDPWQVADLLLLRGRRDAAERLAAGLPAPHADGLRRWLVDARGASPAAFTALKEVRAATCARAWARADALARAAEPALGDDPTSVALHVEHARALAGLGEHAQAGALAADAAATAERLAWWRQAASARHLAALETLLVSPVRSASCWLDLERVGRAARDDAIRATALEGLATARERSRDVLGAILAIDEAVALRVAVGEPGPWARAEASRGALLLTAGRKAEALEALERAADRAEAAGDRGTTVATLAGLGTVRLLEGDAAGAVPLLRRAAELAQQLDAREQAARVLVNLGQARHALGETALALEDMRAAEELFARVGDQQGRVRALVTVALLRTDIGDVAGALRAGELALGIARTSGDTEGAMLACNRLACNLLATGDDAVSDEVLARCATLPGVGDDVLVVAARRLAAVRTAADARSVLADLGPLLGAARRRGDPQAAARFVLQAAALRLVARDLDGARRDYAEAEQEASRMHDERLLAAAQAGTASVYLAEGNAAAALAWARSAVTRVETLVRGLGDEEGALARASWRDVYAIGAVAATAVGDVGWAHWFGEAGRAGSLLEALGARDIARALAVPQPLTARADAARRTESLARAAVDGAVAANLALDRIRPLTAALDEAVGLVGDADAAVERRRKTGLAFYPRPASLGTVQAALASGDVLVAYQITAGTVCALVVTDVAARLVQLGPLDAVHDAIAFDPTADRTVADAAVAAARRALVEPLRLGAGVARVLVVPDGELAYVPFGALLPDVDVALLPSATSYLRLLPQAGLVGRDVLALGDPVYGTRTVGDLRGAALVRLPGTAAEVEAVGDVKLLRERATVAELRATLARRPRWRAVHLGCHGVLDAAHPAMSALYVTATADSDGRIRAADLLRESIAADLVVLSACETARGTVVRAEGVLGLARAVMHAGAPRVVASLWKVDDAATQRLMTELHTRWKAGMPAAAALREAQAVVRAQPRWAHPSFWAAWVLWGLPR